MLKFGATESSILVWADEGCVHTGSGLPQEHSDEKSDLHLTGVVTLVRFLLNPDNIRGVISGENKEACFSPDQSVHFKGFTGTH